MSMSKFAAACGLSAVALTLLLAAAPAAQAADSASTATKKTTAKKSSKSKKAAPVKAAEPEVQEEEPDTIGSVSTDFDCEMGNKVTIFKNEADEQHIALRWKKRLHRLTRVGTTTGAQRFENPVFGLIWIGIPAKGMLLDSKLNRQLANECKDAEQAKPQAAAAAASSLMSGAPAK